MTKGILLKTRAPLKHCLEPKDEVIGETPRYFVSFLLPQVAFFTSLLLPALVRTQLNGGPLGCGYFLHALDHCILIRALKSVLHGNVFMPLSSISKLPFFF